MNAHEPGSDTYERRVSESLRIHPHRLGVIAGGKKAADSFQLRDTLEVAEERRIFGYIPAGEILVILVSVNVVYLTMSQIFPVLSLTDLKTSYLATEMIKVVPTLVLNATGYATMGCLMVGAALYSSPDESERFRARNLAFFQTFSAVYMLFVLGHFALALGSFSLGIPLTSVICTITSLCAVFPIGWCALVLKKAQKRDGDFWPPTVWLLSAACAAAAMASAAYIYVAVSKEAGSVVLWGVAQIILAVLLLSSALERVLVETAVLPGSSSVDFGYRLRSRDKASSILKHSLVCVVILLAIYYLAFLAHAKLQSPLFKYSNMVSEVFSK